MISISPGNNKNMKKLLILENNEILQDISSISSLVPENSQKELLNKCLSKFFILTQE